MMKLGNIPIYHPTNDIRIQDYLNKNITTHQLLMAQTIKKKPKSNGNIRTFLALCLAIAIWSILAWGIAG